MLIHIKKRVNSHQKHFNHVGNMSIYIKNMSEMISCFHIIQFILHDKVILMKNVFDMIKSLDMIKSFDVIKSFDIIKLFDITKSFDITGSSISSWKKVDGSKR